MKPYIFFVFAALVGCTGPSAVGTSNLNFVESPSSLPDSYRKIKNDYDGLDAPFLHSFSIEGGDCQTQTYGSTTVGDCDFGSVRSMLREVHRDGRWSFAQPHRATYSWDMLIPNEFPTRGQQTRGSYIFAQWKAKRCPHASISHSTRPGDPNTLYLRLQTPTGDPQNHDCADVARIPLVDMNEFKGQWHRLQVQAHWSHQSDGQISVFIDGEPVGSYFGPTLYQASNDSTPDAKNNHFDIGAYLCCTGGVRLVQSGTVYFTNVTRSASR